eukprot:CAMPEP_0202032354 /NCGR_PEP_ID=MMETSP0905-20130828/65485_1 /ASSEMBLY_ACC=CAM_ASM_000554 /TAXON_ID=420261 /ORGANISM="Thalassiosira antarctica, Strain CCMP982" /LENGTH=921 /DNA_ID=CAMNT_0048596213 /DNA_START=89 /DNA_END=2854 /DNA_ORIENTATION=+
MARMNDENCPPQSQEDDVNLSMSSVKAGAAVFGNLVFGSEYPDHSLCYSPSPLVSRRNNENARQAVDGKVLSFDKKAASPKKPKEKALRKNAEAPKIEARTGLRQKQPKSKAIPHRKNPRSGLPRKRVGYKQHDMHTALASDSVIPTISNVRRSREENLKGKMMSVAELREHRRQEREEVAAFNVQVEQTRRDVIDLRKKLNDRFRQSKLDREQKLREERLAKVENEIQFNSRVHVEHKRTLKEQEDMRRRMSTDTRAKLRKNHQEGKERMKLVSIQEDQAHFEDRHESSVAVRNAKSDNAEKRRNSFAFRNGDARRIRELFSEKAASKMHEEHESCELKWAGERDADDYKRQMAQERRDSLAFRNTEGRRIRDFEGQIKSDENHNEHESFELKWSSERDADDYKKQMDKERRDSLASRNVDGKRIRDFEGQVKADEHHNEHESYELKWAGERDADDYKKQMNEERRDSLAFRNAEGGRIRDLESQMKAGAQRDEHESYELNWAGERDGDEYKKQMAQQRRDSLAFRNAEGKRIQGLESRMKSDSQQEEHESNELKWAGERDADDYRKKMAQERRESLAFRNAEGKRIRELEGQLKSYAQQEEHESNELKWAGERDADDYRKKMAQERRESLAFRNAEGKRIRELEGQLKSYAQQEEHESNELKWAGERDADDYKKKMDEEKRESLNFRNQEAARHDVVMRELLSLAQEREHESYMLKWDGENDSEQYLANQAELRRQSLAFRNAEGRRHRDIDEEKRVESILDIAQNEELNSACQRDVQHYKEECAARDRASFCFKGKEHFVSRLQAENDRELKSEEDHESHVLDTAAWQDVNDYVGECNRRKRLSLAFRAKEKRRHFQVEKEQAELKIHRQHLDTHYRSEDARYIEMAKLKEKARIALESFNRSPTCSFGSNPFGTLLE